MPGLQELVLGGGSRHGFSVTAQTRDTPIGFLVLGSAIETMNGLYAKADVEAYVDIDE